MTKLYEEVFRGNLSQALDYFQEPRGEFTLVLQGAPVKPTEGDASAALAELQSLKASGVRAKEAVATASQEFGLSRREAYRLWLALPSDGDKAPGM